MYRGKMFGYRSVQVKTHYLIKAVQETSGTLHGLEVCQRHFMWGHFVRVKTTLYHYECHKQIPSFKLKDTQLHPYDLEGRY